tara:strand:- start:551 stop:778 length:228 start_codon:yes stop_codon:yes gene_type:complete
MVTLDDILDRLDSYGVHEWNVMQGSRSPVVIVCEYDNRQNYWASLIWDALTDLLNEGDFTIIVEEDYIDVEIHTL